MGDRYARELLPRQVHCCPCIAHAARSFYFLSSSQQEHTDKAPLGNTTLTTGALNALAAQLHGKVVGGAKDDVAVMHAFVAGIAQLVCLCARCIRDWEGGTALKEGTSVSNCAIQSPLYDAEGTQAVLREAMAALRRAQAEPSPETDAVVDTGSEDNVFMWTPLLATLAPYASWRGGNWRH